MTVVRLPLRALQALCAAARFASECPPPLERGTRWSAVSAPGWLQIQQMPWSRSMIRLDVRSQPRGRFTNGMGEPRVGD